jgi:hypothetical protein
MVRDANRDVIAPAACHAICPSFGTRCVPRSRLLPAAHTPPLAVRVADCIFSSSVQEAVSACLAFAFDIRELTISTITAN